MFEKSPQFTSIVVLGNFNPAILSIDFLRETCGIEFSGNPEEKPDPFSSSVKDDHSSILVELSRYQISSGRPDDESVMEMVRRTESYLNVLPHTPITAIGINFHYLITDFRQEDVSDELICRCKNIGFHLGKEIEIGVNKRFISPDTSRLRGFDLKIYELPDSLRSRVTLNNLDEHLQISINFEIRDSSSLAADFKKTFSDLGNISASRDYILNELFDRS